MTYKCEACGKRTSKTPNTLCLKCQAKGYYYRWGTLMRDKRVGKTANSREKNLKKLIKGKDIWSEIEGSYSKKKGALEF